jgi:hypothetical protein
MIDLSPPAITVSSSMPALWPADGKVLEDTISGSVRDLLSGVSAGSIRFRVTDEYGEIQPAGSVIINADGAFSFDVLLEARRLGSDVDGREYRVIVSASDAVGNQSSSFAIVIVPHDQRK